MNRYIRVDNRFDKQHFEMLRTISASTGLTLKQAAFAGIEMAYQYLAKKAEEEKSMLDEVNNTDKGEEDGTTASGGEEVSG